MVAFRAGKGGGGGDNNFDSCVRELSIRSGLIEGRDRGGGRGGGGGGCGDVKLLVREEDEGASASSYDV